MSFPPYAAYKDSAIEWIGQVPDHWTVGTARSLFVERDERSEAGEEDLLTVSHITGVTLRSEKNVNMIEAETTEGYKICQPGDLAINTLWAWMGAMGVSPIAGLVSPAYNIYTPRPGIVPSYVNAIVRMPMFADEARRYSKGVWSSRLRLYPQEFFQLRFPVPPLAEQFAIAAFLDRETAKIDALVAEQERLMALLKEKRQAVISQAVTKGLDLNAPMKPSGVEWLGQVPAHWSVKRVKQVARLESGHTPSKQFPEYWQEGDIEWVSLNDSKYLASHDYISDTAMKITRLGMENSSARLLPEGAVVFTRDATIGLAAITTKPMAVSQHLIAWCPSKNIFALYLLRVFNVMKPFLDAYTFGATIKTIGMPDVGKLVTPVPPLEEQIRITAFLDVQMAKLDNLVAEAERAITLLKERRAALISTAVTGKIDVRGLVPAQAEAA